jgi:non-specific serine/threonine protein kinase
MAVAEGEAMSLDAAVTYAREQLGVLVGRGPGDGPGGATQMPATQPDHPPDRSRPQVTELSPREQQVAALLAQGLSNRRIAERLVVTERTVAAHIEHILDKLGFASRHQVAAWAADHGLVNST